MGHFLLHMTSKGFVWRRVGCRLWKHAEHHFYFSAYWTWETLTSLCSEQWVHSVHTAPPPTLTCHCIVLCVQREAAAVFTYFIGPIYQCYWMTELLFLVKNQLNALGVIAHANRHIFFTVPANRKLVLENSWQQDAANGNPTSMFVCHYVSCQNQTFDATRGGFFFFLYSVYLFIYRFFFFSQRDHHFDQTAIVAYLTALT